MLRVNAMVKLHSKIAMSPPMVAAKAALPELFVSAIFSIPPHLAGYRRYRFPIPDRMKRIKPEQAKSQRAAQKSTPPTGLKAGFLRIKLG
jgi:hypothetical protein